MDGQAVTLSAGSVVDERYELQTLLGAGGSGRVYRARQRSTGQSVAVKILSLECDLGQHARERRKARFRREMNICGRLAHPDIVRLIDFGEADDLLYSVFEFLPGRTLAQVLQTEGALPVARAHGLALQLLQALAYSHARGVIHRDLKPSNLMLLADGQTPDRIKVLDFGISAMPETAPGSLQRLTLSNEMVGTPAYAAPEQLRGEAPTPKTDLYSWGLILVECLTGQNPMQSASLGEIFQRQLSPSAPDLPPPLRDHPLGMALRWVLEKDAARRAGSAQDLLTRIGALSLDGLANAAGYLTEPLALGLPEVDVGLTHTTSRLRIEAERRQVTALCCRLVLHGESANVDPVLLDAYRADLFSHCKATVEAFGGTTLGGVGDSVLFGFGVHKARDTGTRTAFRVALELCAQIRARSATLEAQSQLSVALKAGLHTGLLTAGERAESSLAHGVVAATAMALALRDGRERENTICTSDAFRRLTERHAQYGETYQLSLSWRPEPINVHELLGESLSDVFARDVGPMIGRQAELEQITSAFAQADQSGRAVVICAEPGLGKSRLAHEFTRLVQDRGRGALTLRCLPELSLVALGALREFVREQLGIDNAGTPTSATLSAALAGFEVDLAEAVPLLGCWLSIPLSSPFAPLLQSPQMQRGMLGALLVTLIQQMTRRVGFLLVEDVQWADHRTKEWLQDYVTALETTHGFLLLTTRPERETWSARGVTAITLDPLSDAQVTSLILGMPGAPRLSCALREKIVSRADGVPLFAEELVRALVHAGAQDVPETLRDLLMSRLDELGATKETAQFAAAIGREFEFDVLRASLAKDEGSLLADLDQLMHAGLVVMRRRVERPSYLFRHALIRDAAYESLPPADCGRVHNAIADALLSECASFAETRPDVIALHLELAGRAYDSQRYWLLSGRRAMQDVAYDEAREHFERGLGLTQKCERSAKVDDAELDQLNGMLAAHVVRFGFGAPELGAILERAQACIERGKASPARTLPLLWGQYLFNTVRPKFERALPIANKLLEVATQAGDTAFMLVGYSALVRCAFWMGNFVDVTRYYQPVDTLYEPSRLKELMELSGEDSYMAAASFAGLAAIVRGDCESGIAMLERLVAAEERRGISGLIEGTLAQVAFGYILRGMDDPRGADLEKARTYALQARDSALRAGFPFWAGYAALMEASARVYQGDPSAAPEVLATMDRFLAAGADIGFGWYHSTAAFGLIQIGALDAAEAELAKAAQHAERSQERFFSVERTRFEALLLHAREPKQQAAVRSKLSEAIALARSTGAQLFLHRARRSMAQHGS